MFDQNQFNFLTQKYFGFLSAHHGFVYLPEENSFESPDIRIDIWHANYADIAKIIWFKSEPEFTRTDLEWLLKDAINYKSIDKNSLEDNFEYYSKLLEQHLTELKDNPERFILNGLKRAFISACKTKKINMKNLPVSLYDDAFSSNLRNFYDYIKKKDEFWDPSKEI